MLIKGLCISFGHGWCGRVLGHSGSIYTAGGLSWNIRLIQQFSGLVGVKTLALALRRAHGWPAFEKRRRCIILKR
jgi:hypothetical protein